MHGHIYMHAFACTLKHAVRICNAILTNDLIEKTLVIIIMMSPIRIDFTFILSMFAPNSTASLCVLVWLCGLWVSVCMWLFGFLHLYWVSALVFWVSAFVFGFPHLFYVCVLRIHADIYIHIHTHTYINKHLPAHPSGTVPALLIGWEQNTALPLAIM